MRDVNYITAPGILLPCNSREIDGSLMFGVACRDPHTRPTTWIPEIFERGDCADAGAARRACARSTEFPECIFRINPREMFSDEARRAPAGRSFFFYYHISFVPLLFSSSLLLPLYLSLSLFLSVSLSLSAAIYYFCRYRKSLVFYIEWNVSGETRR